MEIIDLVESGTTSRQHIANRYSIGKSTVHDIHKNRDRIRNFALEKSFDDLAKRRRVDISKSLDSADEYEYKETNGIVEEETLVENFDHEEFDFANEQEYEIVYDPIQISDNHEITIHKTLDEPKIKTENQRTKRKSKTLTLKEKYNILNDLEDKKRTVPDICRIYNIGRTTVYDFIKNKQKIIDFIEKSSNENRRTFKQSNYPEVERNLCEFCDVNDFFTKPEFFETCKKLFAQVANSDSSIPSQFCGSWSWCKRFFDRHPEFRRKLITSHDELLQCSSEFSPSESLPFEEVVASVKISNDQDDLEISSCSNLFKNDFNNTQPIKLLKFVKKSNVSKSTIYDSIENQSKMRQSTEIKSDCKRKFIEKRRHSILETELMHWCLSEPEFPSCKMIAEKASNLFKYIGINGNFNPTTTWVKKFIQRHPELHVKNSPLVVIKSESDAHTNEVIIEDERILENNLTSESFELVESQFLPIDDDDDDEEEEDEIDEVNDEYIVEELLDHDCPINEGDGIILEEQDETNKPKDDISDEDAMKSLKVLIRYSEQKGHDEISHLLIEYQNILKEEMS